MVTGHVTLIAGFDRLVPSAGGTRSYVEGLERYLEARNIPHLVISPGACYSREGPWLTIPVPSIGSSASVVASLVAHRGQLGIPEGSVIHAQRPDYLLPFALTSNRNPSVCTFHGNPWEGIVHGGSPIHGAAYALLEDPLLRRIDRLVFVDSSAATAYLKRYPWISEQVVVIPNAVDRNRFRPRDKGAAKRRWNLDGFVFLYAGRYAPEKRLASIVRAFQSLRTEEATLVVAGLDSVEFAVGVETTGSPVVFVGALPHDRMSDLLNAADVVVLFSKREGVPSIALEALSSGVPVIATSTGALPSIIRPGETGFLVSSEEELVEAMRSALGAQLAPAEVVSASVARYGWSEVGPQLERVYAELSASRP